MLRGAPGVGKSELLRWVQTQLPPARCLQAAGVQSELELPFATLHQLLHPVLTELDRLPTVQADALRSALGWAAGQEVDRFLVAVATLTLLTDCASDAGLVCLLDDAQWMDSASLDAVVFVARRLEADGVAMIMAVRDGDPASTLVCSLPVLDVRGLSFDDAAALLAGTTPGLAEPVVRSLVTASGGNPLALLDLPGQLTAAQRLGEEPLPEPLPVGWEVQRRFATLARLLPQRTRDLLVVVAADDTGRMDLIARAADAVSADLGSLGAAEAAGLIRIAAGRVEFRHTAWATTPSRCGQFRIWWRRAPGPGRRLPVGPRCNGSAPGPSEPGLRGRSGWRTGQRPWSPAETSSAS